MAKRIFLVFASLMVAGQMATAATFTVTYDFSIGGFISSSAPIGTVPPVSEISGSFTTTFETISGNGQNPSTLDAINLSINGVDYSVSNTELIVRNTNEDTDQFSGRFEIGGVENGGVYGGGTNSDDFHLFFTDSGGQDGFSREMFRYTVLSGSGFFDATTFEITRSSVIVPEPGSTVLALTFAFVLLPRRRWDCLA